tara:strand:- start:249 stop:521 length:273 start_codon:yes stop_codon:yes gene_type:complete
MSSQKIKCWDNILNTFPNASYEESDDPMLTDDWIYLTDELHIQVNLTDDYYSLIRQVDLIFRYLHTSTDLSEVLFKAKCEVQPNGLVGMN